MSHLYRAFPMTQGVMTFSLRPHLPATGEVHRQISHLANICCRSHAMQGCHSNHSHSCRADPTRRS